MGREMSGEGDGCGNAVLGFVMRDDTTIGRHRGLEQVGVLYKVWRIKISLSAL